jgi:hydrogenase maturation protease
MQRILVAGLGNIFLGDDGFGVEVARELMKRDLPAGVQATDFGIRAMDLVYALLEDHDAVIFVDTTQRGDPPGTLYLIEPTVELSGEVTLDTHGMDPVKVLKLARVMGAKPTRTYVVGCEPERIPEGDHPDVLMELSASAQAAVPEAVSMVIDLVQQLSALEGGVTAAR